MTWKFTEIHKFLRVRLDSHRSECSALFWGDFTTNGNRTDTDLCPGLHWTCPKTRKPCVRFRNALKTNWSQMKRFHRFCWSSSGSCWGVIGLNMGSFEQFKLSFFEGSLLKMTSVRGTQCVEMMLCFSPWASVLTGSLALYPLQELECLLPKDLCLKELRLPCTLAQSTKPMSQFSYSPSGIHLYSGVLMVSWLMEMIKASLKWCSGHAVAGTESGLSWWVTPAGWQIVH